MQTSPAYPFWCRMEEYSAPVGVAKPRRALGREIAHGVDAAALHRVPVDRRVLAVHMHDLLRPHAQLGNGIDQLDQLMRRLPFKPQLASDGTAANIIFSTRPG